MTELQKTCQCNRFQSLGTCDHVRPFEPVKWTPPPYPDMPGWVRMHAPPRYTHGVTRSTQYIQYNHFSTLWETYD